MNERSARDVVLVRAIETADVRRELLSDEDRLYASRSARELAQWQAADSKSEATLEHFLQQRSEQIIRKMSERMPSFRSFAGRHHELRLLSLILPALALVAGVGLDRIADPHRVDLLSAPLLLIIGWNLLAYVALLVLPWVSAARSGPVESGAARWLATGRVALPRKLPHVLAQALPAFAAEWAQLSGRLTAARVRRMLHLSAALFAAGAILSLYARGMLTQYATGWESTFLDAAQVHALLSILFAPAIAVFGLQGFSIADIETLRAGPSSADGARWVHLYAATLLLLVVLPRALLAAFAHWRAKRLAANFPLDLEHPYFRKLGETLGARPGVLRVLPYSFNVDEARDRGLAAIAVMLLGEQARVMLRPSIAYGEAPQQQPPDDPDVTLTAVLFSLAATPEKENHGALLHHLTRNAARGIAVLIDESPYLERLGNEAVGRSRIAERIALWQQFCEYHQAPATIVNLLDPGLHPLDSGIALSKSASR
jgi:hypothetical protein